MAVIDPATEIHMVHNKHTHAISTTMNVGRAPRRFFAIQCLRDIDETRQTPFGGTAEEMEGGRTLQAEWLSLRLKLRCRGR